MYGHHGSKAAGNMVGRLLSFDLRDRDVVVAMIHVSDIDRSTPSVLTLARVPQDGDDERSWIRPVLRPDGR